MKNVFTSFALKSLTKNKSRTAVSILGVILSVGLLTAVFTSVSSLEALLLNRTMDLEGSWMISSRGTSDEALDTLIDSDNVDVLQTSDEVGETFLDQEESTDPRQFLVRTIPETIKGTPEEDRPYLVVLPELTEGRLPQNDHEIILPINLKGRTYSEPDFTTSDAIDIESSISCDLGSRVVEDSTGQSVVLSNFEGFVDSDTNIATANENYLVGAENHTFDVVGFYQPLQYAIVQNYLAAKIDTIPTAIGITGGTSTCAAKLSWATTKNLETYADIDDFAQRSYSQGDTSSYMQLSYPRCIRPSDAMLHHQLLRYLGYFETRYKVLYDSLSLFALTLALVIGVASISLIYNSFAISVTERTRQFGLLSSLGASKRQLRNTVIVEALLIGLIGIPLGILAGLGGVTVAFAIEQESFTFLFQHPLEVTVSAPALLFSAVLGFVVLIASAWIPALRASRVNAIDAIRQTQDIKLSKFAKREIQKQQIPLTEDADFANRVTPTSWRYKVFGVPAFLAGRNLSRDNSKGRIISASLAISILLFLAAGGIATYMSPLKDITLDGTLNNNADVTVESYFTGTACANQECLFLDKYDKIAQEFEYTEKQMSYKTYSQTLLIPSTMLNDELHEILAYSHPSGMSDSPDEQFSNFSNNGDWVVPHEIVSPDKATWDSICKTYGIKSNSDKPQALVCQSYIGDRYNGKFVSIDDAFTDLGTIQVLTPNDADKHALSRTEIEFSDNDLLVARVWSDDARSDAPQEMQVSETPIELIGFVDNETTPLLNQAFVRSEFPQIILSPDTAKLYEDILVQTGETVNYQTNDSEELTKEFETLPAPNGVWVNVTDFNEQRRTGSMIYGIIRLFIGLFAGIMMLIAIANVFNTLTNSVLLRTREFAVLKSIGMDSKAFAKMLTCECASYAMRGFVGGMLLGLPVLYGMYRAMNLSFIGISFTLPWTYITIALLGTLFVLAISVFYALWKSKSQITIDSLRKDAL